MRKLWMVGLLGLTCWTTLAWGARYSGQVMDEITGEGLPGAEVITVAGPKVVADANGRFALETDQPTVGVAMPGYQGKKITLQAGENRISLTVKGLFEVSSVKVKGKADDKKVIVGKQELSKQAVKASTVALFPDVVRVVQMLPGVTSGNDFSSQLYVRGGEPSEVRSILDNLFLLRDDIWGGMLSVFNPNLVEDVQFYSGGFSAEWPQAMSGILDIKNKTGDPEHFKGFADMSATTLNLFAEGPAGPKDSSFIFGVRRTYYDWIANIYQRDGMVLPYFWDGQAKFDMPVTLGKFTLNTLFSDEGVKMKDKKEYDGYGSRKAVDSQFDYNNQRINLSAAYEAQFTPEVSSLTLLGAFYEKGHYTMQSFYEPFRMTQSQLIMQLRHNWQFLLGEEHILKTGVYVMPGWGTVDMNLQISIPTGFNEYYTKDITYKHTINNIFFAGAFIQDDYELVKDKVYVNPGVIAQYYSENKQWVGDPRLAMKYKFTPGWDIHAATGFYSQHPLDSYMLDKETGNPNLKASTALHYILGTKAELEGGYMVQVEGYYKDYRNLVYSDANPDINYSNNGRGRAYGFDLILQKKIGESWDGWISYSYVKSERRIDHRSDPEEFGQNPAVEPLDTWYTSESERPHTFNLILNYAFTPAWKVALTHKYIAGRPYTPIENGVYQPAIDEYIPVYGVVNSARMAAYSTTDIKVTMPFFGLKDWSSYVQVTNLFNNENPYGIEYKTDYSGSRNVPQLPRMILGGIRYDF